MMKRIFATLIALCALVVANAQLETPAPSPLATLKTTVGLTDVEVEYSRPSKRDRVIYAADGLVPFGSMWRTGANASTKITFSKDVTVGGKALKAGTYAIYTKPGAEEWTVYFYNDLTQWGVPQEWKADMVAAEVTAKPEIMANTVETFLINIGNVGSSSADLEFIWENTVVPVKMGFATDEQVMASIDRTLAGPGANDYYRSARYYYDEGKDLNQALGWMEKAIAMRNDAFWYHRLHALILADLGRYSEAIQAAETSKMQAEKAGNSDYVNSNTKSIQEWSAKVKKDTSKQPNAPKKVDSNKKS